MTLIEELKNKNFLGENENNMVILRVQGESNKQFIVNEIPNNLLERQVLDELYSKEYKTIVFVLGR